ncbi:MAG: tRNA 2-thiocytidine biosynthesis protein TtcA [Ruminococcus sp.]|nr:tRNA 2-thiocytidine biosynthesis protein TtcA [Ruminococcus sp.]
MQRVLGQMRKAINEYGMISEGDRICVGVSGGKDSLVLLTGLLRLRKFIGIGFDVVGLTIDPYFGGTPGDYSSVAELCEREGAEYHILPTQIGQIVFDVRKEPNPCSLCARMRRGALHNEAVRLGCNKIALGHNFDDAVETFIMNLFNEGRLGCFSPKNDLDGKELTLIRPLVLATEKEIRHAARSSELQIVKSKCPADGHTSRQQTKEFLAEMERRDHGFKDRIFGAMRRSGLDGW